MSGSSTGALKGWEARRGLMMDQWQATFKLGRNAGQEDVALEILRYDPSFAHQIARQYLSRLPGHEPAIGQLMKEDGK